MTHRRKPKKSYLLSAFWLSALTVSSCIDSPQHSANDRPEGWPITAASAAGTLEESGLACREEGRELYPVLYACSLDALDTDDGIYLYANERNDLVGIRAFASAGDPGSDLFFALALGLAYGERKPAGLGGAEEQQVTVDGAVLEQGTNEGVRYLRITPLSDIQSPAK